ncbi:MAG: COR domain-containing protein [Spirosomataceae bacterium]
MSKLALKLIEENKRTRNPFLDLGYCGIKNYLPDELFDCYWIEKLSLGGFYEDKTGHKQRTINFQNNKKNVFLKRAFEQLKLLPNLINLQCEDIGLSELTFLELLTNLKYFNASNNFIYDIDCELPQLWSLNLSKNKIRDISFLSKIPELNILSLSANEISEIDSISFVEDLEALHLIDNKISNIEPLRHLKKIRLLTLRNNQISDIKPLSNLLSLTCINLSKNHISDIKPLEKILKLGINVDTTSDYSKVNFISLAQNPLSNPPLEIVNSGRMGVIRYFKRLDKEGSDFIYEAKLTLVGEGGAGKTSLQRKIVDENATLPNGEDRTRGIKVFDWEFKDKNNTNYAAHIWDFGGQDVYYPVHRFFLTENSVYILMASTRFTDHKFDYWIPTIYQFGGKSPIILVQNCDNGNQKPWEDIGIFYTNSEYNLCRPFYRVNLHSTDFRDLNKLKRFIEQQIIELPHIGKAVPKSWVKVRELLIEESKISDCISFETFSELCRKVDLNAFSKEVDVIDLGQFLHDLGIILWYYNKDELKKIVILKPEWAMNAVYKIIDDINIQIQNGNIFQMDFHRIWHEKTYRSKVLELRLMLEVFKIAFPKRHRREDYILPARLSSIPDEKRWKNTESYLRLEYYFDFMPRGIVNQVSAELSKMILTDESVWNNAVILKNDDAQAQIIEEYHYRKIHIKAKGRNASGIVAIIKNSIEGIINEYRGVIPIIKVPCNCNDCNYSPNPTLFDYNQLITLLIEKGRTNVTCNESDSKLNIEELLYSIGFEKTVNNIEPDLIIKGKTNKNTHSPEIFFSYAWDKAEDSKSGEKIVKELYESLKVDGKRVIIDRQDLGYKSSISDFMLRIGKGDFIVVAISDAYLKSINCMYEFYEIYKNSKLNKEVMLQRIYPIRVESISLNKPTVLEFYIDYWERLEKEWEGLILKKATRIGASQQQKFKKIQAIASELGDFLDFLNDINSKTKEDLSRNNFEEIKRAIEENYNKY